MFDVFTDVHQYLTLNEVERSMLVNRYWNKGLKNNRALRQHRTFSSLHLNLASAFVYRHSVDRWKYGRRCIRRHRSWDHIEINENPCT